jgi:hypothetical protein
MSSADRNGVFDTTFSGGNYTFTVDDFDGDLKTTARDGRLRDRRPGQQQQYCQATRLADDAGHDGRRKRSDPG